MNRRLKLVEDVRSNPKDEGFVALAPGLPGCSALGATQGEALDALQDAIAAWIEAATAAGHAVPAPSRAPVRLSA